MIERKDTLHPTVQFISRCRTPIPQSPRNARLHNMIAGIVMGALAIFILTGWAHGDSVSVETILSGTLLLSDNDYDDSDPLLGITAFVETADQQSSFTSDYDTIQANTLSAFGTFDFANDDYDIGTADAMIWPSTERARISLDKRGATSLTGVVDAAATNVLAGMKEVTLDYRDEAGTTQPDLQSYAGNYDEDWVRLDMNGWGGAMATVDRFGPTVPTGSAPAFVAVNPAQSSLEMFAGVSAEDFANALIVAQATQSTSFANAHTDAITNAQGARAYSAFEIESAPVETRMFFRGDTEGNSSTRFNYIVNPGPPAHVVDTAGNRAEGAMFLNNTTPGSSGSIDGEGEMGILASGNTHRTSLGVIGTAPAGNCIIQNATGAMTMTGSTFGSVRSALTTGTIDITSNSTSSSAADFYVQAEVDKSLISALLDIDAGMGFQSMASATLMGKATTVPAGLNTAITDGNITIQAGGPGRADGKVYALASGADGTITSYNIRGSARDTATNSTEFAAAAQWQEGVATRTGSAAATIELSAQSGANSLTDGTAVTSSKPTLGLAHAKATSETSAATAVVNNTSGTMAVVDHNNVTNPIYGKTWTYGRTSARSDPVPGLLYAYYNTGAAAGSGEAEADAESGLLTNNSAQQIGTLIPNSYTLSDRDITNSCVLAS